jgi:acetylornithine/succinyldiaminopimelate/putrescine aminotransferase
MNTTHPLFTTWQELERRQTPNFFRLYLNPFVAQTCFCLNRLVQETFNRAGRGENDYQTFLANSFDEALSGAVKLARYASNLGHRANAGLVFDPEHRLGGFASIALGTGQTIEFVPDVEVISSCSALPDQRFGFVVLPATDTEPATNCDALEALVQEQAPLLVAYVSQAGLAGGRLASLWNSRIPDVVVFDGSFVHNHVPFGAFSARKSLYDLWNRRGFSTFHSTTFQPNAISSLHFMMCLKADSPDFCVRHAEAIERLGQDAAYCKHLLARLYNPALCKTIATLGMDTLDVQATGHYVSVRGRRIFDGVSGIACSLRGHNPRGYADEMRALDGLPDYHEAARKRLQRLTGLDGMLPAVSGASAVENALRLGLVAQHPRNYVLALKNGFGGKTLFALTGTANSHYKTRLDPLYPNVVYVDPFAPNAIAALDAALEEYPVAVVQLELIQGVGGVRAVPEEVARFLDAEKRKRGYLLFVDEVQTGMYRTGPFIHSKALGIEPDLVTIGKGASDMMFPFSATLYSSAVRERLEAVKPDLIPSLRARHDLEFGYKTLINALDRAEVMRLSDRVSESGALFLKLLKEGLTGCQAVRDVRGFGLLIAIELDVERWPHRWLKKQAHSLYLLNMLRDPTFPVLVGFCQYEPHVLKLTPPLTTTEGEVHQVCDAIVRALRRPFYRLLPAVCSAVTQSYLRRDHDAGFSRRPSHEPVAR